MLLLPLASGNSHSDGECSDDNVLLQVTSQVVQKDKVFTISPEEPSDSEPTGLTGHEFPNRGPDEDGLCGWSRVFGPDMPATKQGAHDLFMEHCQEAYSEVLCTSMSDEVFSVFKDDAEFNEGPEAHPTFCLGLTEIVQASIDHLNDHPAAAMLARSLMSKRASGHSLQGGALEKSLNGKFLSWSPAPAPTPYDINEAVNEQYGQSHRRRNSGFYGPSAFGWR